MGDEIKELPQSERTKLRREVNEWVAGAIRKSGRTRAEVAAVFGQKVPWLSNRMLSKSNVSLRASELEQLASMLGTSIPDGVAEAAQKLGAGVLHAQSPKSRVIPLAQEAIAAAGTAAGEMSLILEAASQRRGNLTRDLDWVRRRFGLGQAKAETLEEIGASAGVTRERVRQIEAKVLGLASVAVAGLQLPMLSSVHQRVVESRGMPLEVLEAELRPFLGGIALVEAARFLEAIQPPEETVGIDRAPIYGRGKSLKIIASAPEDSKLVRSVSSAARKLYSFAGAALVPDVRSLVESDIKRAVAHKDLIRILEALPELQWLDDARRWFWFETDERSSLLRKAATILVAAGDYVPMETLYAGLVREARRDFGSIASEITDPVPPGHVVHAILVRHPDFRRGTANSFSFVGELDLRDALGQGRASLLAYIDSLGGVATREELTALESHPTQPVSDGLMSLLLYSAGFIERIGPGTWAIRGRRLSNERRQEALIAGAAASPHYTGALKGRPKGPMWEVTIRLSAGARKHRRIDFSSSEMPEGVAGPYTLPDGHEATLVQDKAGNRLTRQGLLIRELLETPAIEALRFEFDSEKRTLKVSPAD